MDISGSSTLTFKVSPYCAKLLFDAVVVVFAVAFKISFSGVEIVKLLIIHIIQRSFKSELKIVLVNIIFLKN